MRVVQSQAIGCHTPVIWESSAKFAVRKEAVQRMKVAEVLFMIRGVFLFKKCSEHTSPHIRSIVCHESRFNMSDCPDPSPISLMKAAVSFDLQSPHVQGIRR